MGIIGETFSDGIQYLEKNLEPLFMNILKIILLSMGVLLAGTVLVAICIAPIVSPYIWALLNKEVPQLPDLFTPLNIILLVIAGIVTIIAWLFSGAISTVAYNAVDELAKQKTVNILSQARQNVVPMIQGYLFMFALIFAPMILVILSVLVPNDAIRIMVPILAFALIFFIAFISAFLFQFAFWELFVSRKGIIESIKSSYALITSGNILKTLLFDILLIPLLLAIVFFFIILQYLVQFILYVFMILHPIVGVGIYVVLYLIISILQSVIVNMLFLSFTYIFWKKLQGSKGI